MPGTLAGPCRVFVPCARARPGQGQAPRCRSLGLAGSRFFFLRGRAVTDNKSDDLGCMRAVSTLVFFFALESTITGSFFLSPVPAVSSAACWFAWASRAGLFLTHKTKEQDKMSPPMAAAREKESNLARLLGSGRSQLEPSPSFGGIGADSLLAGSAGIAELAIFHPVRSPDDLRLQNSDVRWVRDGKRGADGLVTDRSIPLRSAS